MDIHETVRLSQRQSSADSAAEAFREELEYREVTGGAPPGGGGGRGGGSPSRTSDRMMPPKYLPSTPGSTTDLGRVPMPAIPRPGRPGRAPLDRRSRSDGGTGGGIDDTDTTTEAFATRAEQVSYNRMKALLSDCDPVPKHIITGATGAFEGLKNSVKDNPNGWLNHIKLVVKIREDLPAQHSDIKAKLGRDLSLIYLAFADDLHSQGKNKGAQEIFKIGSDFLADSKKQSKLGTDDVAQIERLANAIERRIGNKTSK